MWDEEGRKRRAHINMSKDTMGDDNSQQGARQIGTTVTEDGCQGASQIGTTVSEDGCPGVRQTGTTAAENGCDC